MVGEDVEGQAPVLGEGGEDLLEWVLVKFAPTA